MIYFKLVNRYLGVGYIVSQCLNKRCIILKDHDKIEIKSDNTNVEMSPLEDASDWDVEYLVEGKLLVIQHALNVQIKKDD